MDESAPPTSPPNDDPSITDEDGLIRHCSHLWVPVQRKPEGGYRVPSNAMTLRVEKGEKYLSVDVESLLKAASLPLTHHLEIGQWAARITAGDVRSEGLGVTYIPMPKNLHHGGIWGLEGLDDKARKKKQKALATHCTVVAPLSALE